MGMRIRARKLLERPQARVAGENAAEGGTRLVRLRVDGMVCDI
ncbi:hypothetical protein LCGC14_2930400 [marine sediment metagenome]|uniref:Uncharacterized protein n=1 Tax=marine sediment metagenome TaxID=412755 RepID=A0A0F9AC67_9ZZZZ